VANRIGKTMKKKVLIDNISKSADEVGAQEPALSPPDPILTKPETAPANLEKEPMGQTEQAKAQQDTSTSAQLIAAGFEARTRAHLAHLQTSSYSAHVALEAFYTEIVPLIDSYAEAWQGRHQVIEVYPKVELATDPVAMLKEYRDWIDSHRISAGDAAELQNIIDTIQELIDSTIYKLTFLK
jgi:hypothetical protein